MYPNYVETQNSNTDIIFLSCFPANLMLIRIDWSVDGQAWDSNNFSLHFFFWAEQLI